MNITVDSFDKICRACLNEASNMKSLLSKLDGSDRNLFDVFVYTTDLNFRINSKLPKLVCSECELIMRKAEDFKRRCHESDQILTNIAVGLDDFKDQDIDEKYQVKLETGYKKLSNVFNQPSDTPSNILDTNIDMKKIEIEFEQAEPTKTQNTKIVKEEINDDFPDDFPSFQDDSENISEDIIVALKPEKQEIYTCYCNTKFDNITEHKQHLQTHHCDKYKHIFKKLHNVIQIKNEISCQQCNRQFATVSGWKAHQRSHANVKGIQKVYKCTICFRKCKNNKTLTAHLRRHENDSAKYVCDRCNREFKYKAFLENHIITFHSGDGLKCEICMQSFTDTKSYEAHKDTHGTDRGYQCSICNKSFHVSSTLKEHLRTHTGEKPFLCSQCGRGFSQRNNMIQHMRRHLGVKPFKCENCEKGFVSKGELDAHLRTHSGAHPFVCNECGNGFTTSSSLVKHKRTHTGERPYACDLCPMRFAATGTLKNHRRTHTGERPYQCSYCEKAFVQKNDLISHIRCHTGERPYACQHCGQRFRKPAGLKTHAKLHPHPHQPENAPMHPPLHGQMIGLPTLCDPMAQPIDV